MRGSASPHITTAADIDGGAGTARGLKAGGNLSGLIHAEQEWRVPPPPVALDSGRHLRVRLARWTTRSGPFEVSSETDDDWHVLTLILRRTRQELYIGGKPAWRGGDGLDDMLLTGPRQGRWRAIIGGDCDNLRVFFPQSLLAECAAAVHGRESGGSISLVTVRQIEDASLRQLAMIFKTIDSYEGIAGPCFVDAMGLAFGVRLIELYHGRRGDRRDRARAPLASDRLRLVLDSIEARLGQPIYLSDLSELVGLSRIRFAAAFKSATGLSPYAYILRRRIARAQEMLGRPDCSLVGIALDLGFSSQAHFTEAFRRIAGTTPGSWRRVRGHAAADRLETPIIGA